MSYWLMVYRIAWGVLIVLAVVGLVCVFAPQCHRLRALQHKKEELQTENRAYAGQISDLRKKEERFLSDPAFVRRTAHESGRAAAGEVVFTFPANTNATPDR